MSPARPDMMVSLSRHHLTGNGIQICKSFVDLAEWLGRVVRSFSALYTYTAGKSGRFGCIPSQPGWCPQWGTQLGEFDGLLNRLYDF